MQDFWLGGTKAICWQKSGGKLFYTHLEGVLTIAEARQERRRFFQ